MSRTTTLPRPTRTTPRVPRTQVESVLREIAFALHATRRLTRDDLPQVRDRSESRPLVVSGA